MKDATAIEIPLDLLRDLVWLQALYAQQLNARDGGGRMAVFLPRRLENLMCHREASLRSELGIAPSRRGRKAKS